jgi:hypothetical protein
MFVFRAGPEDGSSMFPSTYKSTWHSDTTQKTKNIDIFTAVRASNLIYNKLL